MDKGLFPCGGVMIIAYKEIFIDFVDEEEYSSKFEAREKVFSLIRHFNKVNSIVSSSTTVFEPIELQENGEKTIVEVIIFHDDAEINDELFVDRNPTYYLEPHTKSNAFAIYYDGQPKYMLYSMYESKNEWEEKIVQRVKQYYRTKEV